MPPKIKDFKCLLLQQTKEDGPNRKVTTSWQAALTYAKGTNPNPKPTKYPGILATIPLLQRLTEHLAARIYDCWHSSLLLSTPWVLWGFRFGEAALLDNTKCPQAYQTGCPTYWVGDPASTACQTLNKRANSSTIPALGQTRLMQQQQEQQKWGALQYLSLTSWKGLQEHTGHHRDHQGATRNTAYRKVKPCSLAGSMPLRSPWRVKY